jgi:hypothetical protein
MEILQGIIEENIDWFWNNDSIVDHETNMSKLWDAFKVWCVQNCKEIFDDLDETIIDEAVDQNYNKWINGLF